MNSLKPTAFLLLLTYFAFLFAGCNSGTTERPPNVSVSIPQTFPMHTPIYPSKEEKVTFRLYRDNADAIDSVVLYETTKRYVECQFVSYTDRMVLNTWSNPSDFPIEFTKPTHYEESLIVEYEFEVFSNNKDSVDRSIIKFATQPYPVSAQPVPVYAAVSDVVGFSIKFDPNPVCRGLLANIDNKFLLAAEDNIYNCLLKAASLRQYYWMYDFFVTPLSSASFCAPGTTLPPTNVDLLLYNPDVTILMDTFPLSTGRYDLPASNTITAGLDEKGALLHEIGHALYELADERIGGANWYNADFPNLWTDISFAESYACCVNKLKTDAHRIEASSNWFTLCKQECSDVSEMCCQMSYGETYFMDFDTPCQWSVYWHHYLRRMGDYAHHPDNCECL